jgi:hypothetical protein
MGYIVFTRFNLEYYFKITFVYTLNHKTLPYIQLIPVCYLYYNNCLYLSFSKETYSWDQEVRKPRHLNALHEDLLC